VTIDLDQTSLGALAGLCADGNIIGLVSLLRLLVSFDLFINDVYSNYKYKPAENFL